MNYRFFFTEKSQARNSLTYKYEPIQPLLLLEFSSRLNSSIFLDVGANIGFYSLVLSLLPSIKKVYSFEASDETFLELKNNIEMNSMSKLIQVENKAVSSSTGFVNFQIESSLSGINSVAETSIHKKELFKNVKKVLSCSIDDFLKVSDKSISLKIDVEGHEAHVIRGAQNLLKSNQCVIQVEIYSDKDHETMEFLDQLGYRRIYKAKNDIYYSNSDLFLDQSIVLSSTELAIEKFINLSMGKWPPARNDDAIQINAYISEGTVVAESVANREIFQGDLEYAFYVFARGEKIATFWYTDSPELKYSLPPDRLNDVISISGFVREKSNPGKKIMKSIKI